MSIDDKKNVEKEEEKKEKRRRRSNSWIVHSSRGRMKRNKRETKKCKRVDN